ncbi:MAG: acyl-CoA dehydrogenase C-terminal domain-containing protein [Hydromonas sp.]|jgi:alkylation response protein AidB-like acyl-CoA dehydrogenase|nr:acyl-CoA dehydrogenase C-terminal domain-containing protein [Hydromonas sp.]MBP6294921.1 acyl-CoA dehydrogenase C-terminal domain-containing protein [Hydromonas sp.]
MGQYTPPLRDIQFVMHELLDTEGTLKQMPAHADMDVDTMNAIVEEAGKFASSVIFPLNQSGDLEGCTLHGTEVTTPKGYKEAYRQYVEAGWASLSCDPEYGGQGLPIALNNALYETLNSASIAWTMYPGLSHGAYECLHEHGTDEIKALYLPKLTTGEWTGTMCLTEPHCGTDLGLLRSKAIPNADGSYSITGTKIFISSGEHDMAENIIHLVLARLPDAEKGTKGISLFIVPKFIPNADGSLGARNPVTCARLEHKMGIHSNSTAEINLDGAAGWLVGQPNKGLQAMFVMMNAARLGVGMQGLGLTEISYQNARTYAKERIQMRALSGAKNPEKEADFIIAHPDVRRMLLTQRAYAEGARAFTYWMALEIDKELSHPDEAVRKAAADNVALLTPIVKAFLTDNAFECTNHGVQVFGGHGFITDNGMEQYVRDARITQIYEGTNGVQALDLLGRKVLGDMGAKLRAFGDIVKTFVEEHGVNPAMQEFVNPLGDIGDKVGKLTMEIGMKAMQNQDEVGAASVPYQRVVGHMVFAYFWARMAKIALEKQDQDDFYKAKLATARFYFAKLLPETAGYIRQARAGVASLNEMQDDWF